MSYSERYCTPSPLFSIESPTTLERLIDSWERLRVLDVEGYRTSQASPMSTWLVQVNWADGKVSARSPGSGTTCSPFVTQSVAMVYSSGQESPYAPRLADGSALPILFCRAANGNLSPAPAKEMARYGMMLKDNGWPRPVIFFNMGRAVEPAQMRRGDAVHIDWAKGGGHAVFCWDVHLNARGEVDAFQFISSNGRIQVDGASVGAGVGVSVGGTPLGEGGFIRQVSSSPLRYEAMRTPLFTDDERYVAEGTWVTWDPHLRLSDLGGCRVRPRGRLALAKKVEAARFHGVVAPEPFAMGAPVQRQPPEESGTALLQRRLKLLYELGLLDEDPGVVDGKPGRRTAAAVVAFQRAEGLKPDGIAGPHTNEKLAEVFYKAADSPEGKRYLATGQGTRGAGDRDIEQVAEVLELYFRHGAARQGETVELVLLGSDLDGASFPISLIDQRTGAQVPCGERLTVRGDRASVALHLERGGVDLIARVDALQLETMGALTVVNG